MKKQGQHASVKYLQVKKRSIVSNDKDGKNVKPVILLVTSELDMDPLKICDTYHNLWKIEESFRITKSYLDALFLTKKEIDNLFESCILIDS